MLYVIKLDIFDIMVTLRRTTVYGSISLTLINVRQNEKSDSFYILIMTQTLTQRDYIHASARKMLGMKPILNI